MKSTIRRLALFRVLLPSVLLLPTGALHADVGSVLARSAAAYGSLAPIAEASGVDIGEAERIQRMLVLNLRPRFGEVVGYKAALTSPAVQQRFGVSRPLTGVLLENMFTSTGSIIDRDAAVRPVLEIDLLVRVGDERINEAASREQVLAALSEVIPFVEVPDLMYASDVAIGAADIVAINAGARLGVAGVPVPLAGMSDAAERLAAFTAEMVDGEGRVLASGRGSALMGHPLDAVLWLKNDLGRQGYRLKTGNLLSLGGIGPPVPLEGLKRVTATYRGLAEHPLEIHIGIR